eukprot:Skav209733  [mRNA]  locus=scaffold528:584647:592496:- [translate_table: standard]
MLLGFYSLAGNVGITDASKSRPWLVRLLTSFARNFHPDFEFTSIQVNKNYASRPHVDKNNLGDSLIIGLGDYTDGGIWVHDPAGNVSFELQEDISCMYHYEASATYNGTFLDIHDKWVHFNGNRLHFTQPFQGDRYTLVYYTCSRYMDASSELTTALCDCGFFFSKASQKLAEASLSKLAERKEEHEKWKQQIRDRIRSAKEELGRCQARTWNKGWGGSCPHFRQEGCENFCKGHANGSWKTHGTIDGPVPKLKQAEMLKFQRQMLAAGERPPDPLPPGAMILAASAHETFSAQEEADRLTSDQTLEVRDVEERLRSQRKQRAMAAMDRREADLRVRHLKQKVENLESSVTLKREARATRQSEFDALATELQGLTQGHQSRSSTRKKLEDERKGILEDVLADLSFGSFEVSS